MPYIAHSASIDRPCSVQLSCPPAMLLCTSTCFSTVDIVRAPTLSVLAQCLTRSISIRISAYSVAYAPCSVYRRLSFICWFLCFAVVSLSTLLSPSPVLSAASPLFVSSVQCSLPFSQCACLLVCPGRHRVSPALLYTPSVPFFAACSQPCVLVPCHQLPAIVVASSASITFCAYPLVASHASQSIHVSYAPCVLSAPCSLRSPVLSS